MKLTKLVKISESLTKRSREYSKYKNPNYPSHISQENKKELEAAGAVNAGRKAIRMTARQLGTTEGAVRAAQYREIARKKRQKKIADSALFSDDVDLEPKKQKRISRRREILPDEEELDKRLGYSKKGEGFAGYENDQDPETHVKIQAKDHARTGSAQQAQYDGTEGKSESKEKPLKVLTDGELEEVEKLKAMVKLLKRDDWDKDEKREREHEEFPIGDDPNDDIPDDAKRKIQTDMRSEVRGKKVPKDIKQEGVDLDEKIGEELGEVPRSRVQGEREGKRTVSDQGKHVGNKFIDDASRYYARRQAATDEKPSHDEIKYVATNAQSIGHALTYEKEEAEKWKSFIKAVNTVNKRRGRGRRTSPKVIEKEGTNAANGTSPRGGNYLGTNDTEAFNVRHNGGRKTNRYGKKPEDLGNFP